MDKPGYLLSNQIKRRLGNNMEKTSFLVTKSTFTKAILSGHLVNIVIGIIVFTGVHFGLKSTTVIAVLVTIFSTTVGAILSSFVATKKLSDPVHELSKELLELHEKVNASTNALTQMSTDAKALLEELPVAIITLDDKNKLTRISQLAKTILKLDDSDPEVKIDSSQILNKLKEFKSLDKYVNLTDWLHEAKTNKIQDIKLWPMSVISDVDGNKAYDILVRYSKSDSYDCEVIIVLLDKTEEIIKQEKQMEFIALAAHELRGPITVMRGIIDVFKNELAEEMSQDHQDLLIRMGVSARQLSGYIENILSVSRIEKDTFEVLPEELDWIDAIKKSVEDLSVRARAHHRKLEVSLPESLPAVAADPIAITHVITNLVDNAIKYSKEDGLVRLTTLLKDGEVETTIQDFGIGIPANVVENLFTKFYRSHKSRQIASGTGLGLYLCKTIIEAHGGKIWVRSSEGKGTTFGFTLPTYESFAKNRINKDNQESNIIRGRHGWIKNHSLYRR